MLIGIKFYQWSGRRLNQPQHSFHPKPNLEQGSLFNSKKAEAAEESLKLADSWLISFKERSNNLHKIKVQGEAKG